MINADKFEQVFGIYATELWAKPEKEFLEWLNGEAQEVKDVSIPSAERIGHWVKVRGYSTPGGDPVWRCSECGKGIHVFGIECYDREVADSQWVACPNCGIGMVME